VRILVANEAFRAVALPAGAHLIEFRYRPASFRIGALVSILTALGLLLAGTALILRRRGGER
jgi:uncharacterized membrane protein YfhO